MHKIKKCPFCGGDGVLHQGYNQNQEIEYFFVKCGACGVETRGFFTSDEKPGQNAVTSASNRAIFSWNMEYKGDR